MLRFDKIVLEDFGPFKGKQELEFSDQDGVTIVFGENMRGKTTLLNSIRYALFGTILGRSSRERPPHEFINWESQEEGKNSFKITLYFNEDSVEYKLVRELKPKDEIQDPETGEDYTEEVFLIKNGTVVGPEERDAELDRILPQQVSRFFLFDGELLQQYQNLLIEESEMGQQIRQAIERILGVPVLKNGRADLRELREEAQAQEKRAARQTEKTKEIGDKLEEATSKRDRLREDINQMENELEKLEDKKAAKQNEIQKLEATKGLVEKKTALERERDEIEEQLEDKQDELQGLMSDSWRAVLQNRVEDRLENLKQKRRELDKKRTRISVANDLASRISNGLSDEVCPICDQNLGDSAQEHLQQELKKFQRLTEEDADPEDQYSRVVTSIETLENILDSSSTGQIESVIEDIDKKKARRATIEDDIKEIEETLETSDAERVRRLNNEIENIIQKIGVKENTIEQTREELDETKNNIVDLQNELDQVSGSKLEKERFRREIYSDLVELFNSGVAEYRDQLRDRVEEDASEIFLELTTEPDYGGLKINDNYGLTILHDDGSEIGIRSAGAEHVVALALIGALQNNAPLQGPIIMDSPFGRLDKGHVENVVSALPKITDQVMLLVYEDEINPEAAREILKGKLRKEYTLERVSARHTELTEGT